MGSSGTDSTREPTGEDLARRTSSRNQLVEWILVDGSRLLLTFAVSVLVLLVLLASYRLGVISFTNDDSVTRMASGMIAGSFSLVTIVVSVNQLILSQEFSPVGEFRDQFEEILEFRRDVEDAANISATPAAPARLLELLSKDIRHHANALDESVAGHNDPKFREQVTQFTRGIEKRTEHLDETLEDSRVNAFDALAAAIEYDDMWQLYITRHLRNTGSTSEETDQKFDQLIEALRRFSTAQAHFKTIYLQRELTRYSQLTIYSGVPAIVAAILIVLLYGGVGGAPLRIPYQPYVIIVLSTVVFLPVGLLASYILRTVTLARRTAAIGPMFPQKDPDEGIFDVTYGETE